jgi:hypothetical protein
MQAHAAERSPPRTPPSSSSRLNVRQQRVLRFEDGTILFTCCPWCLRSRWLFLPRWDKGSVEGRTRKSFHSHIAHHYELSQRAASILADIGALDFTFAIPINGGE